MTRGRLLASAAVLERRRPILLLVAATLAGCCGVAAAQTSGPPPLGISADTSKTGYVALHLQGRPGATLVVSEDAGGGSLEPVAQLRLSGSGADLPRALQWRCDRRTRRILVEASNPGGGRENASTQVQTPSCRKRLKLTLAPRRPLAGRRVRIRVTDRWGIGNLQLSLCTTPPGGLSRCRPQALKSGQKQLRARFRALRIGAWLVTVKNPYQRARRSVRAHHRGNRLSVLAAGDSMIEIVDSYLGRLLKSRHGRVRTDDHISTGISKPSFDWRARARKTARRLRPDVTVMFIGANDGFNMRTPSGARVVCCGEAWSIEYGRRARQMMRSYARHGAGRVYWLLLPTPREGFFRRSFPAVNAGLRRAAKGLESDVRLIHLEKVFSPGGQYRDTITWHGRRVDARQGDGIHLSTSGASIAAQIVVRALRQDRIVR